MSNFYNSDITSFLSNKYTPQKQYQNNYFDSDTPIKIKLFTSINPLKKAKNIFSDLDNSYSNFNKNISNNQNIFENKNIFNNFNSYNYKDSTIGEYFKGYYSKINKENVNFMSITSLPEFSHGSNEEFRLADFERKKTGNIIYFKVQNRSSSNNNFFEKNDYNNINDDIFYNNNYNYTENSGNNNINDNENIFNRKIESKLFNYKNNSYKQLNEDTLFKSNIINNDNQSNNIFFSKKNNYNSPFSYLQKNQNNNNLTNSKNNTTKQYNFNNNNQKNNNINITNNKNEEEINNSLDEADIYKLLTPNEKLTKEINEAIKNRKTVKEFLEDLYQQYKYSKNSENINENNSMNDLNNSFTSDIYGSFLSKSSNSNGAKIELKNPYKEVEIYNMEIDNDINYDKLASKINNIYGIKTQNKFNNKINNGKNKSNKINLSPNQKHKYKNIDKMEEDENENENIFNKTFSNGFTNYNCLLKNPFSNNITNNNKKNLNIINNLKYTNNTNNTNKKHIGNSSSIFVGRNESLFKKNMQDLNKLSITTLDLNEIKDKTNKNTNENNNNSEIFFINNNEDNNKKIPLKKSINNNASENINLNINYNLIDIDKKDKNENVVFYDIILENINQMITVKDFKEQLKQKIYDELKKKNIYNYSLQKISLLTYHQFLSDNNILHNYKLHTHNYTLQAYISYKKTNNKNILFLNEYFPQLNKKGYKCSPTISELRRKTPEELEKIENFKIYNKFGEVEFKEPVNLLGMNLDNEITIEKNMIDTSDKLNYWSVFKLYDFIADEIEIKNYIMNLNESGGKFISYKNNVLIWEYKGKNENYF